MSWVLKDEQAFLGYRKKRRAFQVENKQRVPRYIKVSVLGESRVGSRERGRQGRGEEIL